MILSMDAAFCWMLALTSSTQTRHMLGLSKAYLSTQSITLVTRQLCASFWRSRQFDRHVLQTA
jgi:hypothetical protein